MSSPRIRSSSSLRAVIIITGVRLRARISRQIPKPSIPGSITSSSTRSGCRASKASSGWPGQEAYNADENHDAVVDGTITPTDETFLEEVSSWQTKRERGDGYKLGSGTWAEEMDAYQAFFAGKTIDEVEEWFASSCSDANGRPLKITDKSSDEDKAKFDALSQEEQDALVDLTSSATISLRDAHGDILTALAKSCENARATA